MNYVSPHNIQQQQLNRAQQQNWHKKQPHNGEQVNQQRKSLCKWGELINPCFSKFWPPDLPIRSIQGGSANPVGPPPVAYPPKPRYLWWVIDQLLEMKSKQISTNTLLTKFAVNTALVSHGKRDHDVMQTGEITLEKWSCLETKCNELMKSQSSYKGIKKNSMFRKIFSCNIKQATYNRKH